MNMPFAFKVIGLLWLVVTVDRDTSTHVRPSIQSRKGLFNLTYCIASHHCLSNAYSVNVNLPSACSWSTLPRMTAKRRNFSLVCLPPDKGGLIAIGRFNGDYTDVVECLDGEGATEWRRLAPLPLPLCSPGGGVFFKQRILVVGAKTMLAFTPPTAGGLCQWVTLKPTLPRAEYPMHIAICGNSLYLVSKFKFQHDS